MIIMRRAKDVTPQSGTHGCLVAALVGDLEHEADVGSTVGFVSADGIDVAGAEDVGQRLVDDRQDRGLRLHAGREHGLPRQLRSRKPGTASTPSVLKLRVGG